jgi:transcriptional accessory protein Tex/SPT6
VFVFHGEEDLDCLIIEVKRAFLGKTAFDRIVVGLDPGEATGLAILADGKLIEEGNCYSTQEVIHTISKTLRNVNFMQTVFTVKIGNGVPVYKALVDALDEALPAQVTLEVVGEAGTNKPQSGRSRRIRHISSAIRIAGRSGRIMPRRKEIAANRPTQ